MRELPKELTVELLSLIMGVKVERIVNFGDKINYSSEFEVFEINLDTLCRKMKEWITKDFGDCIGTLDIYHHIDGIILKVELIYNADKKHNMFRTDLELEAIAKATHWVAVQKGLIDG